MARQIMTQEIHLRLFVPARLAEGDCAALHRTLVSQRFLAGLRRAIRAFLQGFPNLRQVRITLTH